MAATERVTILMEPAQKAALTKHAQAMGQSVGEYVRRRALDDDNMLDALVAELRASTATAMHAIDATVARIDARERAMAAREATVKEQVRELFTNQDVEALIQLFAQDAEQRRHAA